MSSKGNRLRFSKAEDEKLIYEVSSHPALYNLNHKLYKDQNVRDNVWKIIAKNMDKSVTECKTRWKSLKDVYWKKKKDMKQGTGSSAKATITWVHMHALNFLEQTRSNRITLSNVSVEEETDAGNSERTNEAAEGTDLEQTLTETEELFPGEEMEDIGEEDDTNTERNSPQTQDLDRNMNEGPPRMKRSIEQEKLDTNIHEGPPRKKKLIGNGQLLETINKRQNERQRIFKKIEESRATSDRNHPIKTFFASMAETVMTFPPDLAVRAKKEVLDLVSRMELEIWQTESRHTTSTSRASFTSMDTYKDYNGTKQSSYNIQESQAYTECADLFSHYNL